MMWMTLAISVRCVKTIAEMKSKNLQEHHKRKIKLLFVTLISQN